jgi:hypothetical protein
MMLEPELREAVDHYFENLKEQVLDRLELGEEEYHGRWLRISLEDLQQERHEEFLDWLAYGLMIEHRA